MPPRVKSTWLVLMVVLISVVFAAHAQAKDAKQDVVVHVDTSQVADRPKLVAWGEQAAELIKDWHPRISNLLASKDFTPPHEMTLVIKNQDKGVGHTSGKTITIMSGWIEKHPEDWGLVIHELTHVIQRYRKTPFWVTEGVADYIRWAIYEGKPLKDFHCPDTADGYTKGYRITAGFFLWLETDPAPGIVSRMNAASRKGAFTDKVFEDLTGQTLQQLWDRYRAERKAE